MCTGTVLEEMGDKEELLKQLRENIKRRIMPWGDQTKEVLIAVTTPFVLYY